MKERELKFSVNEDKTPVQLDEQQRKNALKALGDLSFVVSTLHRNIKEQNLETGFKESLLSLIENHSTEILKALDFESQMIKDKEERYVEIRNLNNENRDLRKQLGEKVSNEDIREGLKNIGDSIKKWWGTEGLGHTSEIQFTERGHVNVKFSTRITDNYWTEDGESEEEKSSRLASLGLKVLKRDSGRDGITIDNESNRQWLKDLIQSRYPSAEINSVENWGGRKGFFEMRSLDVIIYDLDDIKFSGSKSE
jgi:hypothetical protein